MKRQQKFLLIILILILSGLGLFLINRDLFQFTYDTRLPRSFASDITERDSYIIDGPLPLKPGTYELSPVMSVEGNGNEIFLIDGSDEIFFRADLTDGMKDPSFTFEISGAARQVRTGINYRGEGSAIHIEHLRISAGHVLYRESVLRHLTVSLCILLVCLWLILRLCFPGILWKIIPAFAKRENELALAGLIILTLGCCFPLLDSSSYVHGEDMFFHITRIRGLAESLRAGYFPVRDQLYWQNNYGYGVGFYYPDTLLYFPALLFLLGFELLSAYKIFLAACSFLSIASAWYAALRISKNRTAAAGAAVFMACAAYRLSNVYYRGALGETQAAMFYPLIILGLYEIFYGKRERWPFFALGFTGLLSCHLISLVIGVVLTFCFLITQLPKIIKEPKLLLPVFASALITAGLGAFFWIPMFEQTLTNPGLRINQVLTGDVGVNGANYAFPVRNLFCRFKAWDFARQAESVYPGWSLLLVPVMAAALWKNRGKAVRTADFLLLFSLPVIWMCTRSFPWEWPVFAAFVTRIQFAYRLLLPASVMLSIAGGIYFSALTRNRSKLIFGLLLVLFCFFSTAWPVLRESVLHRSVPKSEFVMQDNRVSAGEYQPVGLTRDYPSKNADTVRLAENDIPLTITDHKRQKLGFTFSYEVPDDAGEVRFSVPLIYYTGYRGTLTTEDGRTLPAEITPDEQGLVSLGSRGISRGSVSVSYQKTIPQRIGEGITIITLIICICCLLRKNKSCRSKEN